MLEKELTGEVDKILAAGHLAPWILSRQAPWCVNFGTTYGKDPSESLYYLSEFLPLLPAAQQSKVRDYLTSEAKAFPPDQTRQLRIDQGARREFFMMPPGLVMNYGGTPGTGPETDEYYEPVPSLFRAYGMARFYQATEGKPAKEVLDFWRKAMQDARKEGSDAWNDLDNIEPVSRGEFVAKTAVDARAHFVRQRVEGAAVNHVAERIAEQAGL